jgi:EpsI family protein
MKNTRPTRAPVSNGPRYARRDVIVGACLLGAAGAAYVGFPRRSIVAVRGSIKDVLPPRFGDWIGAPDTGFVTPPEDERKAAAIYDEQLTLAYRNSAGARIMLLLAYARTQSSMLMVHRPESCYPGAGFKITSDRAVSIQLAPNLPVPGRFISAQQLPRIEQVLYWTRLGNEFVASWDEERESLARQNLRGFVPDGALVRVSVVDVDETRSRDLLLQFVAELYQACGEQGRALLRGPLNARETV